MSDYRGRFLWYELMSTDPAGAQAFYPKLTGWSVDEWKGMDMGVRYFMFMRGGFPTSGLMELPKGAREAGAPSHWLAYVGTPHLDETLDQARSLGARVLMGPMDVPGVGRSAVLADTDGAVFGLYRPERDPGEATAPQIGDCSWHELAASDGARAFDFYHALFGWEKKGEGHDMGPMGIYQEFGCPGGAPLGGIYTKPADMPAPPHWMLYFRVADVGKTIEAAKAAGSQLLHGPTEVPGGDLIAGLSDPQGAAFSVHQPKK